MSLDFSEDWEIWDNVEEVTYTSVTNSGDVEYTVRRALKRAVSAREASMSRGAYRTDDVNWIVPRPELPTVKPQLRDRITDDDGTVWTVLNFADMGLRASWRMTCRALSIVEQLRDTMTIERPTYIQDDSGARQAIWAAVYSDEPCRLQPQASQVSEERGLRGFKTSFTLFVSRELSITNEDRVLVNGTYYEVRAYRQSERIDQLPQLDVELPP